MTNFFAVTGSGMKTAIILIAIFVGLSPAFALDVRGDLKKGKVFRNVGRAGSKIVNQGRIDLTHGLDRIDPRITQFGRDFDRMRLNFEASVRSGPALEAWLRTSRTTAMRGAMPIPPMIEEALQGWYPPGLLKRVRYKVGEGGLLNLANNSIRYGHAQAVTLIDVIVFKGPYEAADPTLWAHELKHVEQFAEWGVHSFAIQYMRSWNGVEEPAYAIQAQYALSPFFSAAK